ncbi:MAG: OmpA family protein [Deltaproteobacteria bacterium]|nr:OmpA family protein [Deltaproteobacteria bacterium]MBW2659357.1 OmpA family protein [Deltaproteobacteria bacterium]
MKVEKLLSVLLCVSVIALSGCGSKKAATDDAMTAKTDTEALGAEESLDSKPLGISEGRTTEGMLPVYFNYDSSEIKTDQVTRIEVNSEFIKKATMEVRIEGNCDPRGTNEYNMALGERRALSAKKYLVNLGVDASRLTTVSYGEERMLLHGHDELSWSQNRRDDFVLQQ